MIRFEWDDRLHEVWVVSRGGVPQGLCASYRYGDLQIYPTRPCKSFALLRIPLAHPDHLQNHSLLNPSIEPCCNQSSPAFKDVAEIT